MRNGSRSRLPEWLPAVLESVALFALFGLALTIRAVLLMEAPAFTDETIEVLFALEVYRGEILPLTNADAYYGPLWAYLLAGAMYVFGPSPMLPRMFVAVTGSLTVLAVYFLGRASAGRAAGLVAAALLVTAPWHVLTHSHIAWSHSLTPLFTTLALLLEVVALRRLQGWLLVLSGLVFGLALQTHPTVIALAPGMALALIAHPQGRLWLREPFAYLAALAAIAAYAPIIVYNLQNPGATLSEGRQRTYAVADLDAARYLDTLVYFPLRMLHDLVGIAVGPIQEIYHVGWPADPAAAPLAILAVGAVAFGIASRRWVLVLSLAGMIVFLPIFSHEYNGGRYMAPVWPAVFALIGASIACLSAWVSRQLGQRSVRGILPPVLTGLIVAFLAIRPVPYLRDYYTDATSRGETSGPLISLVEQAISASDADTPVLLDSGLATYGATYVGASALTVGQYVLSTHRKPYGLLYSNIVTAEWLARQESPMVAVISSETRDTLSGVHGFNLERVSDDLGVRIPTGAQVRNIPSPLIPVEPSVARPLALYRISASRQESAFAMLSLLSRDGRLAEGWSSAGWRSSVQWRPDVPDRDGRASLAMTFDGPYGGQLIHGPAISTQGFERLELDVHGGTASNQPLLVSLRNAGNENIVQISVDRYSEWGGIQAGSWRRISIPISEANPRGVLISGIELLMNRKYPAPTIYVGNIRFVGHVDPASSPSSG